MPITVKYTGALGPASIVCAGIRFEKNVPVIVEEDAVAEKLLAKHHFTLAEIATRDDVGVGSKPAPISPDVIPALTGAAGRKEKEK